MGYFRAITADLEVEFDLVVAENGAVISSALMILVSCLLHGTPEAGSRER